MCMTKATQLLNEYFMKFCVVTHAEIIECRTCDQYVVICIALNVGLYLLEIKFLNASQKRSKIKKDVGQVYHFHIYRNGLRAKLTYDYK